MHQISFGILLIGDDKWKGYGKVAVSDKDGNEVIIEL